MSFHPFQLNTDPGRLLQKARLFLLDMDGTLYLGNGWIDGALPFLARLEESGKNYLFLTNNSSKGRMDYVNKLASMGLAVEPERIVTSLEVTAALLKERFPGARVFLLGNALAKADLQEFGILLDEAHPDVVVTAFDTSLDYAKMHRVCNLMRSGLPYVATHPDLNCPTPDGCMPDIGAIHAFIEASTGRKPDLIAGKPSPSMTAYALAKARANPEDAAIVGDRLYTDIAAGVAAGVLPVLVLSGETTPESLAASQTQPALVFSSVAAITPLL